MMPEREEMLIMWPPPESPISGARNLTVLKHGAKKLGGEEKEEAKAEEQPAEEAKPADAEKKE